MKNEHPSPPPLPTSMLESLNRRKDLTNSTESKIEQAPKRKLTARRRDTAVATGTNLPAATRAELQEKIDNDLLPQLPAVDKAAGFVCAICRAWYRADLELRFDSGVDMQQIATHFGLKLDEVRRHMTHRNSARRLEATVEGVTEEIAVWRTRTEQMYDRLNAMLSVIENGLVERITPDGKIVLNTTRFADIKPIFDLMHKCTSTASSLLDQFAKVHKLFAVEEQTGPRIIFNIMPPMQVEPVVIDCRATTEESVGSSMRLFDGEKQKDPVLDNNLLKVVDHYMKTGSTIFDGAETVTKTVDASHLQPKVRT